MRLTRDQVGYVSQHIVPEQVIDAIAQVLTTDLEAEDRLNDEVREVLQNFSEEISRGSLNYQELFRKVKAKLARERKMVI